MSNEDISIIKARKEELDDLIEENRIKILELENVNQSLKKESNMLLKLLHNLGADAKDYEYISDDILYETIKHCFSYVNETPKGDFYKNIFMLLKELKYRRDYQVNTDSKNIIDEGTK